MKNRNVIGIFNCRECSNPNELRVDAKGKVYYFCGDEVAQRQEHCEHQEWFDGPKSTRMKAQASREGWLGDIPNGYTAPIERNIYAKNFTDKGGLDELKRQRATPAPTPEPIIQPEPIAPGPTEPEPTERTEPRGRKRFI